MGLELDLGLAIGDSFMERLDISESSEEACGSCLSSNDGCSVDDDYGQMRKRIRLVESNEADSCATGLPRTLPLFIWNGKHNDDDDDDDYDDDADSSQEIKRHYPFPISINAREGDSPVGWPPVKSHRKRLYCQDDNAARLDNPVAAESSVVGDGGDDGDRRRHFIYVKVQMEGAVITRKVNLSFVHRHQSYDALTRSLVSLFGKGQGRRNAYLLTYQDKEGDWMLAGDLPWR